MSDATKCAQCDVGLRLTKDFFITVNERKARAQNFCSVECVTNYLVDLDAVDVAAERTPDDRLAAVRALADEFDGAVEPDGSPSFVPARWVAGVIRAAIVSEGPR